MKLMASFVWERKVISMHTKDVSEGDIKSRDLLESSDFMGERMCCLLVLLQKQRAFTLHVRVVLLS